MAKLVKDVAGFGVIFWTPTVVNSLIQGTTSHFGEGAPAAGAGQGHGSGHGGGDGGVQAALLTAVPFALAAGCSYAIARRSQVWGLRSRMWRSRVRRPSVWRFRVCIAAQDAYGSWGQPDTSLMPDIRC